MKRRTPEQLAELPNATLVRMHDRIRAVWQRTRSENTSRRCECRMSVIAAAARIQDSRLIAAHAVAYSPSFKSQTFRS